MTTAYITKYALTTGIYKTEGTAKDGMFVQPSQGLGTFPCYFHGKEWHLTKEDAIAHAEEMRIKKLKSIDKQMKKISALKFTIK